jgi:hypothetical protein
VIPPSQTFLGAVLEQVECTASQETATNFLVPAVLDVLSYPPGNLDFDETLAQFLGSFQWFAKCPERHALFLAGDNSHIPSPCRGSPVFMPSCRRSSNALPLCYFPDAPVTGLVPIDEAPFEVSFQGTIETGHGVRARMARALQACQSRRVCCRVTDGYFHMAYGPDRQRVLRAEYDELIARSQFVFCPRGDGLSSRRFFETLSHGRLPILVADEAALPLEAEIPYDDFVVRVPERQVERWEVYLDAFLATHSDLGYCSSLARNAHALWFTTAAIRNLVERSLSGWRPMAPAPRQRSQ